MSEAILIDIVIPVYNEAESLESQVRSLVRYLSDTFPFTWRVTIADNGSTDDTHLIASRLASEFDSISVLFIEQKGRGEAIRSAWMNSDATICCFMDLDLSTGLNALLPLIAPLITNHSDLAIGTRLGRTSNVARGPKREVISRVYNFLIRLFFAVRFTDAQCGFKAIRTDAAKALLPAVQDNGWFFDTELLLLAEHNGLRIHEVAVDWIDDPDSRVNIRKTAIADLRGLCRMAITFIRGKGRITLVGPNRPRLKTDLGRQLVSFALIGTASTAVAIFLFIVLVNRMHPIQANILTLVATTPLNMWSNRRFTFGHRTRADRTRHTWLATVLFVVLVLISSFLLGITDQSSHAVSLLVAISCWTSSSVARFALLRNWVFKSPDGH